jgi:hypothetical protein
VAFWVITPCSDVSSYTTIFIAVEFSDLVTRNSLLFMRLEVSLSCSKKPATGPNSEPQRSWQSTFSACNYSLFVRHTSIPQERNGYFTSLTLLRSAGSPGHGVNNQLIVLSANPPCATWHGWIASLWLSSANNPKAWSSDGHWLKGQKGKCKGKVIPVRLFTEHHAMKAYWGSGSIAPHILGPRH